MRNFMKKSILALGLFIVAYGWIIHNNVIAGPDVQQHPELLYDEVWKSINTKYVDGTKNSQDWATKWRHKYDKYILTEEDAYVAIDTMLASLNDPYTRFLDPKESADEHRDMDGSLKGIGIQMGMKDGKITVIAPIEDTPAEKAGLLAGDVILEINGESTKKLTLDKASDQIRGPEGTEVTLLIKRENQEPKTYTIKRAKIEIKSVSQKVPESIKIPNDICYIRLASFISRNASQEFRNIIEKNKDKNGFIIDLRSNPGGLLSNAISISSMFLDRNVIVDTVNKNNYHNYFRANSGVLTEAPVVILINKGSASASEIFSGAMKDHGRAILVGEQTFGKGLVQSVDSLPGGSGLHITIEKYLTPNGIDIHKKGIAPDIEVKLTEEDIKNKNDVQLKKAIEVVQTLKRNPTSLGYVGFQKFTITPRTGRY